MACRPSSGCLLIGLLVRGSFGEMVETLNLHQITNREPLYDPSYANQDAVDNNF